jgi:hypothetical protein
MTDQTHKFQIGQLVDLIPRYARSAAHGTYEIVGLVPTTADDPQYRVKSTSENHARVVPEGDLSAAYRSAALVDERSPSLSPYGGADMSISAAKAAKSGRLRS